MLCVPVLSSEGEPIGAIQVVNSHTGKPFTQADIELLTAFRGFIQITIMNRQSQLQKGIREVMDVDAGKIDLAFLSDRVVQAMHCPCLPHNLLRSDTAPLAF